MGIKKIFKLISIAIALFLVSNVLVFYYGRIQCNRMIDAIKNDDAKKLEWILHFSSPDCVNENLLKAVGSERYRCTPLGEACKIGDFEMVKLLVEDGADVNYVPPWTEASPLGLAAGSKSTDNLKIVKYLIENGADVEYFKNNHVSPIDMAVSAKRNLRSNEKEILAVLLENGADFEKERALEAACSAKNEEAIRYLVEEWEYDASDPKCIGSYCYGIGECSYETFEYFLERGANPYEKFYINDYIGEKSAIECLQKKSPELAEQLIDLAAKYGITE